jgi:pentatricopeptide repeat protein
MLDVLIYVGVAFGVFQIACWLFAVALWAFLIGVFACMCCTGNAEEAFEMFHEWRRKE